MKTLLSIFALLFSISVYAATATWTAPTEYTNGAPFDVTTDLDHYDLTCTDGTTAFTNTVTKDETSHVIDYGAAPSGNYSCTMITVDVNGLSSDPSIAANFTVPVANPKAATGLRIH